MEKENFRENKELQIVEEVIILPSSNVKILEKKKLLIFHCLQDFTEN